MKYDFPTQGEMLAAMFITEKWLKELVERFEQGVKDLGLEIESKHMLKYPDGDVEPVFKVKTPRPGWTIELRLGNMLAEFLTLDRDAKPVRMDPRLFDDGFARKKLDELVKSRLDIAWALATSKSPKEVRRKVTKLGKDMARLRMWEVLDNEKPRKKRKRRKRGR